VWSFDLKSFAFEKIGLSRNYDTGQLKARLRPALQELQTVGVIESPRFSKQGPGAWSIEISEKPAPAIAPSKREERNAMVSELVQRGVHQEMAQDLATTYAENLIREKLFWFDWLVKRNDKRVARNAPGFLVSAIREDYVVAKQFRKQSGDTQHKAKSAPASAVHRVIPEVDIELTRLRDHLAALSAEQRNELESAAVAAAPRLAQQRYRHLQSLNGPAFESLRLGLIDKYLRQQDTWTQTIANPGSKTNRAA
jgi:hypothetical protein